MIVVVRRLVVCLGLSLIAGVGTASAQSSGSPPAAGKIAFINARALLQGMTGYAKAESTYTKELQAGQGEAQKLQAAWDSTVAAYEQSKAMLSPTQRSAREKTLGTQQDSLQAKLQTIQDRVASKERELLAPMQTRLGAIIEGIRAEGNFWMVIDYTQTGTFIVSYDKSLDITERVARRLSQSN